MAGSLAARGVQYIFGLPGGEIVAFIDACRRAGIRFLLTGHEASAAWMAQVVGQITGVPGVCAATLGPGATNLVTGVANAWLDRAPMLTVTAQIPGAAMETMTHQRVPLDRLFAPITKGSFAVGFGDTVALVEHSMDRAAAPRPGPVHISLPSDLAVHEYHERPRQEAIDLPTGGPPDLHPISTRLEAAARPIVIIGLGAMPAAAPAIRAFIDRLQAPFLVTPKAKGIASEDHPLFAGVASGMAIDRDIVETIKSADLVIGIGFDPVECDKTWFADVDVVSIDSASMVEGRYRPLEAIGDLGELVACLNPAPKPWHAELPKREAQAGLSPLRLIEELRSIFPRDGIAACDVGSHKLVMGQFWRSYEPGTFFMSNGLSGMGFGLPAAIAAQLCHPQKHVMAVVGDGGMLMMIHDLVLIRELGLPILIVVLSDRSLSLIRVSEERRGFPAYGVDFTPPDFAAIAQAFGIAGRRVASIAEAKSCAERALTERAPFVIDVPIDYREYYDLV
uniref:Acetolactate synthase n=1 Tax=uncultured Acidobacteriota bacterium TaxID=171953 RepID=G8DPK8_9BACT|nr:acetolactate synthase [uncultured Acidobacteriota bacterium]